MNTIIKQKAEKNLRIIILYNKGKEVFVFLNK